jgi:ABC-type multidrug transport system fused ATPase/permease subunit
VRKPKVLVLDEATADLDSASANELLRVMAEGFADTTVVSIAHRLKFIEGCDKILVLNTGGTINAFDSPSNLVAAGGYFATQLATETATMSSQ